MQRIPASPPSIEPVPDSVERPLWSVMIPVFNCINYLKAALESVLIQDPGLGKMQIEVIDDCSTDGDVEALVKKIGKGRVGFFRQPVNTGSLRNFETCIRRARGHYVQLLHGDDEVLPGYYNEIETLFKKFPEAGAAFTNFFYINYKGERLDIVNVALLDEKGIVPGFLHKIAAKQLIQPPAVTVKRSTYEALGSFFAVHFGEDWEMWTRIASRYPVASSPDYLACYRIAHGIGISHESFLSGQNLSDITRVINIIQDYIPDNDKKKLKRTALSYYSVYTIKIANSLLVNNRKTALMQVKGALKMSLSLPTLFWTTRFYLMYILRFKQVMVKLQGLKRKRAKHKKAKKSNTKVELQNK